MIKNAASIKSIFYNDFKHTIVVHEFINVAERICVMKYHVDL